MDKFSLPTADDATKALRLPLGAASPLWFAFAGAAAVGAAYWWSTRWMRPMNLEALTALPEPTPEAIAEPVVETVEAAAETIETVADEVIEAPLEPVVEAVAAVIPEPIEPEAIVPATPDDLTRLVGVGPKLAVSLAERGVTTFAQIAAWTADDLASVDKDLKLLGRAERDAWVAQAKRFLEA